MDKLFVDDDGKVYRAVQHVTLEELQKRLVSAKLLVSRIEAEIAAFSKLQSESQ